MIFASPRKLRALGILGMNERNGEYVMKYNPRRLYPLVDDKLKTKHLAQQNGIAVPELYGVVETQRGARDFATIVAGRDSFVVKPAQGAGGEGVLVVVDRPGVSYRLSNGTLIPEETIQYHISRIISGLFSLGGLPDKALIEYMVRFDPFFESVSYQGVPDVRVIVFLGVPVAAMVRLPTRKSDGKANLHQGALGVGIDIATGETTHGVCANAAATSHPDTGKPIRGFVIPHWDTMLALAARCADLVGLGYLGVDIVLDRDLGPLVLELNARPGLNVQIANRMGLLGALHLVEAIEEIPASIEERLEIARRIARECRIEHSGAGAVRSPAS
jgi:alpha-L-glutamate ligase-like protein